MKGIYKEGGHGTVKAYIKPIILSAFVILISICLYSIFVAPIERGVPEYELILIIVKTIYAVFDLGVIVALFR